MREGWKISALGDVCDVIGGGTPSKRNPAFYEGNTPWATVRDMRNETLSKTEFHISQEAIIGSSTKIIPKQNVVIATRVGLGKVCLLEQDTAINQDLRGVIPKSKNIDVRFLFRWFQSIAKKIQAEGTGATVKGVKLPFIKSLQLPLPPLSEQKRIVATLDDAFTSIDAAIANTEKNLANARELFDSYLDSVFSQRGDGWVEKPLIHFVDSVSTGPFGSLLHKSDYVSVGVPLVNPVNIVGEEVIPDEKKMISDEKKETLQSYILKKGDIVIARRGEIGRCAVITDRQKGWVCGTGCFFIRPGGEINPHLLAHLLRSFSYRTQLERLSSGATMLNLSNSALKNLKIVIPSMSEQNKIADQIMEFKDQFQEVQSIYQQKLTALAELKQSLLQKAFSGELTADKADSKDIMDETQNVETALT